LDSVDGAPPTCSTRIPTPFGLRPPDAQIPYGLGLRRFCLKAGEVFCFYYISIVRGGCPPPKGFWPTTCFSAKVTRFCLVNASRHHMLSLAGYSQSTGVSTNMPIRFNTFMDNALGCSLGLISLPPEHVLVLGPFTLPGDCVWLSPDPQPGGLHTLQPGCPIAKRVALYGYTITGDGQPARLSPPCDGLSSHTRLFSCFCSML
jgi:hypothetical protein